MDEIDRKIIDLLQTDNRLPNAEIGQNVGLSVSAANERVRRLNGVGVIRGNVALLDPDQVGLPLCAFIFVDLSPHPDEAGFRSGIAARPEVQEIHQVSGSHCYLLKVRVPGTHELQRFLSAYVKSRSDVLRTETIIVLETSKETPRLATDAGPAPDWRRERDG